MRMTAPPAEGHARADAVIDRKELLHRGLHVLAIGGEVTITRPCIISVENHKGNIQGGA
jgi:hypothetical protein